MFDDLRSLRAFIDTHDTLRGVRDYVLERLGDDPGHDLSHCLRVAWWTIRLGRDELDPVRAVAAALLHDVVNPPKDSIGRAAASEQAAEAARECLVALGFDPEAVDDVAEAVRDHSYSRGATPARPLGRALQDADRLEALGALGIFRTASCGTRMGARFVHPDDPWATTRPLDDTRYTTDHFFAKLLRLPGRMNTEQGRSEARRRVEFMRGFLRELAEEIDEPPPEDAER